MLRELLQPRSDRCPAMEIEEFSGILLYANAGAVFGAIVALLSCRSPHPFKSTIVGSGIGGPMAMLFFVAISGAWESIRRFGFDPIRAIAAAVGICFFAVFAVPVICGLPAMLTGLAAQAQLQRMKKKNLVLRFRLSTLMLSVAVVPPCVAYAYFEPAWSVIIVSALIATFTVVSLAMATVQSV